MVQKEKGSITNARKQKLVTAAWLPEGTPTAAILWHHGMGEYADRFDSGGYFLNPDSWQFG